MKIYRVDLDPASAFASASSGDLAVYTVQEPDGSIREAEITDPMAHPMRATILVRAPTAAAARRHALEVISVRIATQDDMLLAVGEGAIEIETVSGLGEGEGEPE